MKRKNKIILLTIIIITLLLPFVFFTLQKNHKELKIQVDPNGKNYVEWVKRSVYSKNLGKDTYYEKEINGKWYSGILVEKDNSMQYDWQTNEYTKVYHGNLMLEGKLEDTYFKDVEIINKEDDDR